MTALLFELDYHHWLLAALVLFIADGFVRGSLPMWLGMVALVEGLALLVLPWFAIHLSWPGQLTLAAPLLVLVLYAWRRYERNHPEHRAEGLPPELLGEVGVLETPLHDGRGKVRVGDTLYWVTGPELPEKSRVRITALTAVAFRVEAADNTRP